ncbi:MAG TPA: hypothetical protein VFY75_04370 [Solirubrobacterales bacterium]|nr:hypothetical protein [Solirubrobacterales bacterium]
MKDLRESILRAFSLVVTDRRWAAPLSAMALGFGLFLGVAIGPGAAGTFAGEAGSIVAVAAPEEEEPEAVATAEREEPFSEPEAEEPLAEPEPFEGGLEEPVLEPAPVAEPAPEEQAPPAEEPAEEEATEAQQLKGTVVHVNPAAGSYTMAIAGGELVSVHAEKLPTAGEKLTVEGAPLPNNTFAEEEREKAGSTQRAGIRGVVTYVSADPTDPAYVVSGRGSSILVQGAAGRLPVLGAYATVGVGIEKPSADQAQPENPPAPEVAPPCAPDPSLKPAPAPQQVLVQRSLETEPEPATYFDLAGLVSAVCPATGQLLISTDDTRAGETDLLLAVPPSIKTTKLRIGDSVVATATLEEGGPLTLTGLAGNEGTKGAEDATLAFGDLKR